MPEMRHSRPAPGGISLRNRFAAIRQKNKCNRYVADDLALIARTSCMCSCTTVPTYNVGYPKVPKVETYL